MTSMLGARILPCGGETFPVRLPTDRPFGAVTKGEAECSDLVDCSRLARQAVRLQHS
jgi:hypothetical protein